MKRIVFLFALTWLAVGTWAQHLTEQEALERIAPLSSPQWGGVAATRRSPLPSEEGSGEVQLTAAKIGAKNIYAFNREGGGFVIASADSRTLPVLGYSDSGSIDWERMPENMRAWLLQYDEAIATLGDRMDFKDGNRLDGSGISLARTRTARAAIEPLIKTRWDQDMAPYYDMCPLYAGHNPAWQGQRCSVGCVAVALAQILNYWQWPKEMPNGLPAYESVDYDYDASLTWYVDSLPPVTFDWESMLDEYIAFNYSTWTWDPVGTEAQKQAVATLMRYCGQAIKSNYSPVGTSSTISRCHEALVDHFGYAAATLVYPRSQFGIDEWEEMVYTELEAGRPIIYGGASPTVGGHEFVCDGYDGDGLFHINCGGQGSGDGYYSLSVLNPWANTDPYKGSERLGFTVDHGMIIGLDPSLEEMKIPQSDTPELSQYQRMAVLSENTLRFYFLYNHEAAGTATADYALGTIDADGTLNPRFIGDPNDSIIYHDNTMTVEIDSAAFQPGETLRLHPIIRFRHTPEAEWQLIPPLTICADAGRTEEGRFFITLHPYMLECVDASITAGLGRIGANSDLTVTIHNPNDQDYVGNIWLQPRYYGHINAEDVTEDTPYTEGDGQKVGAYIRGGQDGEAKFLFNPKQGGLIRFMLLQVVGRDEKYTYYNYFTSFTMRFDTIYSYEPYLVNNSYVTHEGNHYVYHVELCDRPGVAVPDGVPSDSIQFDCRIGSLDGKTMNRVILRDEIKDYLRALPDNAGSGNYKFTLELSLDIEQDGEYYARSYMNEWLNAEQTEYIFTTRHREDFSVTTTDIGAPFMDNGQRPKDQSIYDLQGRKVTDPTKKGIYIKKGKKTMIR